MIQKFKSEIIRAEFILCLSRIHRGFLGFHLTLLFFFVSVDVNAWDGGIRQWGYYRTDIEHHMQLYDHAISVNCVILDLNCATTSHNTSDIHEWLLVTGHSTLPEPPNDCGSDPSQGQCGDPNKNPKCPATGNPIVLGSGRKYISEIDIESTAANLVGFTRHYNYFPDSENPAASYRELWNIDRLGIMASEGNETANSLFVGSNSNAGDLIDMSLNRELNQLDLLDSVIAARNDTSSYSNTLVGLHLQQEYLRVRLGGNTYFTSMAIDSSTATSSDPNARFVLKRFPLQYVNGVAVNPIKYEITDSAGVIKRFGLHGQILEKQDPDGNKVVYGYTRNDYGYIDRTWTDSFGHSLELQYVEPNHVTLTDSSGREFHYLFDDPMSVNPRLKIIFPDNTPDTLDDNDTREFEHYSAFDANGDPTVLNGALKAIYNNGELFISYEYDAVTGYPIHSEKAGGQDVQNISYVLSPNDNSIVESATLTNPLGKETKYSFSLIAGAAHLTQVEGYSSVNCAASNSVTTYDENGFIETHTDENGIVTRYVHDSNGHELLRTEALGRPEERTITTEWHAIFDKPVKITEPDRVIEFNYDAGGNTLTRIEKTP